MKRLSLKFLSVFISTLIISVPVVQFYSPPATQALVSSGFWTNRTPRTGQGFNTDIEYQRFGRQNSAQGAHTPFAELIETRPASEGGGQVIHWFLGIPNHGEWSYNNNINFATIMHTSDQGTTWNRITPPDLKGCQMNFKVVPETWHTNNDPSQSRWSGKLFLYADKSDNDYALSWYRGFRPALYRYDGDGFTNNWTNLISENVGGPGTNFNDQYLLGTAYYHRYISYGQAFQSHLQFYNGRLYLLSFRISFNGWPSRARLAVHSFDGPTNQLINSNSPLEWTRKWESDEEFQFYPYFPPSTVFYFEQIDDYLFTGTEGFGLGFSTTPENTQGVMWQSDANGENFEHNLPLPPTGTIVSTIIPYNQQWRYSMQFDINIGGTVYRASTNTGSTLIGSNNGNYSWTLRYNWRYTWWAMLAPWNYYYGDWLWHMYYNGREVAIDYSWINHSNNTVFITWLSAAAGSDPMPIWAPISMIEYKGYAYAGFSHTSGNVSGSYATGKLRRTNRFLDEDDNHNTFVDENGIPNGDGFNNWEDCGDIVDVNHPARNLRQRNAAIVALSKTLKPVSGGGFEDDLLFIGPSSWSSRASQGWVAMFTTDGLDEFENDDQVPIKYTLHEDEWWYDEDMGGRHFRGIGTTWNIYSIYSIMNSSVGQLVFFTYPALSRPGEPYWGQRNIQILNAAPSLRITHEPDPFIIERGQSRDLTFELLPSGGFGLAGFRMQLIIDATGIFLPNQDPLGNPYTENQKFSTRLTTPGPLLFFDTIPWEVTPTLRTTMSQPLGLFDATLYVTDQLTGMVEQYNFRIQVVPPRPGFSVSIIPSTRQLYAGETVCFNVNLESRFDFEDNVIVGIFWQNEPPQNDTQFEWMDSTYIYDRLDDHMVEVITRRNIGTQYQFCLHTEKTVSPGNFEFVLMFFSTVDTRMANVRVRILPPRPTFSITTNPRIGKTVPGGIVHYDIVVESIDNYVGPVSLYIENLPATTQMVSLNPTTVNLSLANPIAYAELVLQTFSATYAPHRPTNFFARVISRSVINLSWESSRRGTHEIAGYEIWRGPNQYIERANRIAIVGPNVVSYDDAEGIESGQNYYYFLRSFDDQNPPNFSDYVPSNEARVARSGNMDLIQPQAIVGTGTLPGYYRFLVSGDGIGIDEFGSSYSFSVTANTDLLVYRSVDDMKTPSFDLWGIILLMFGLMGFVLFQHKKKRWEPN